MQTEARTINGVRLVLVALVLALASKSLLLPVWLTASPLDIVRAQVLASWFLSFAVGVVGFLSIYLLEWTRQGSPRSSPSWDRERLSILAAGIAAIALLESGLLLGYFYRPDDLELWDLSRLALRVVVMVGVGLFLVWTAARLGGNSVRRLSIVAFAIAVFSALLDSSILVYFVPPNEPLSPVGRGLIVGGLALGAISLAFWIVVYTRILQMARSVLVVTPVLDQA